MAQPTPQARRRGLGMGLSALLGEAEPQAHPEQAGTLRVPIEFLRPSPFQPRRAFADDELEALAASLREHGVLQPLLVRPASGAPGYEIVAGERRWRAAQRAGLHEVPVVVRELGDRETLELALVENLQRSDLAPLEEAQAFQQLIQEFGHTQEVLAGAVGKSRSHIANTLRLLGLDEPVREMLADGRLSAGHARALLGAREPQTLAALVVEKGLNVRQTEELVRHESERPARASTHPSADTTDLARQLTSRLGLEVGVRERGKGGVLTIRWRDETQLEYLLKRLE
jgi:ParB family transcriptional regulator, chromosome partitioning protein